MQYEYKADEKVAVETTTDFLSYGELFKRDNRVYLLSAKMKNSSIAVDIETGEMKIVKSNERVSPLQVEKFIIKEW